MRYQITSLEVHYEAQFRDLFFPLISARAVLVEQLYRTVGQPYGARAGDLHSVGVGTALSGSRARLNLFRGSAFVEVSAEKLVAEFKNATLADKQIVIDCVKRAVTVAETVGSNAPFSGESIRVSCFLTLPSAAERTMLLASLSSPVHAISMNELGPLRGTPGYKIELQHPSENWIVSVDLSATWGVEDGLFLTTTANFFADASSKQIDSRAELVNDLTGRVLKSLGLEPVDVSGT